MKSLILVAVLAAPVLAAPKPKPQTAEQKEADRHFKSGVALFSEQKFAEALAEFQRAYEIAPAPIVLLNIAACHRELSQYGEAVAYYKRFLAEGEGKVPPAKIASAKTELDAILARIARVTVTTTPKDAALTLDGVALASPEMPLVLAPGEHKLVARVAGYKDAEKTLRVASGDELEVDMKLAEAPQPAAPFHVEERVVAPAPPPVVAEGPKRIRVGAAFGTNLRAAGDTGAPDISVGIAINSRLEVALDAVLVAYAVMPSARVRLVGDQLALHAVVALPIAFAMDEKFVAAAFGLGLRYRATPAFSLRLDALASIATKNHGTTVPAFVGGELWF
jgi:tetratricopeptide (TPR) repeat protein